MKDNASHVWKCLFPPKLESTTLSLGTLSVAIGRGFIGTRGCEVALAGARGHPAVGPAGRPLSLDRSCACRCRSAPIMHEFTMAPRRLLFASSCVDLRWFSVHVSISLFLSLSLREGQR